MSVRIAIAHLVTAVSFLLPVSASSAETGPDPSVQFIYIRTAFSLLPSIYIDEWGNARIDAFCKESMYVDFKPGAKRFGEAAKLLDEIEFWTIPHDPNYRYETKDGKKVLLRRDCDHCATYSVTWNGADFWDMHTVKFIKFDRPPDRRVDAVEAVIRAVIRGQESKVCPPDSK